MSSSVMASMGVEIVFTPPRRASTSRRRGRSSLQP
jgi:hypothetical protein